MLSICNLHKVYPGGDIALSGVDLNVPQGQVVAVIGPSGAGKSTLIRCVNRLLEPSGGSVYMDGTDITALNKLQLRQMRRTMGMIFQEYALVERLTVMENILAGRLGYVGLWRSLFRRFPQQDIDLAFELLDRVGLLDHIDKRADALSGGQRQRVGIARALMQTPRLLLVDEPTASLDPKTSRQIMRLLTGVAKEQQLTVLINIHDVSLASLFAERIVGMRDGVIVYDGSAQGLDGDTLTLIYGEEDWSQTASNSPAQLEGKVSADDFSGFHKEEVEEAAPIS